MPNLRPGLSLLLFVTVFAAAPSARAEEREFCADRPGLGTPPCTLAPGDAMVELGVAAWDHSRDAAAVEDDTTLGDVLVRFGLGASTEVQFGLTSHVRQRMRDRVTGVVSRASGLGDGLVAVRQGLAGPNGPVALQAFVTLPVGSNAIGGGEWGGGMQLPVALDLGGDFELGLTPEMDVTHDGERSGYHVAWGGVAGLSHDLGDSLSVALEAGAMRDDDPDGHSTDARTALSLAWQVRDKLQLDAEVDVGLSQGAPDRMLAVGLAWRFH